ncbi:hypothetical protein ACETK8_09000 [Brevundimonas staleyi]|uniref:DUF5678 domain-containing protein n=1 Tax=Brevundimonas staleyi TaxID=74326 RepID=A0ABW0FPN3_9CAUL
MSVLSADIARFEAMRTDLEHRHKLKWVVFHEGELIDIYSDFEAAASDAIDRFDTGPFLIRQIGAPPQTHLMGGMVFTHANA